MRSPDVFVGAVRVMMVLLPLAGMSIVGYVVWRAVEKERRRAAEAAALAARHGFLHDARKKPPPPQRFDLFTAGRSQQVRNQLWRAGESDSVFDYQYETGGDNSTTRRFTCALVHVPFDAPHTKIGAENFWSGLGRRLGIRDIEVESPRFNDRHQVTSDDERFAVTLLDGRTIDWFLHHSLHSPTTMNLEFRGPWMLCIIGRIPTERCFGFLDWATTIPAHLPAVLASLYPVPPDPMTKRP